MSKNLKTSPFDKRQYMHIILPNKLNAILISDSDITYSAASMSVGVGSYYDPLEFQGISHFLEHMLFMGSEKYPDENYFSEYIKENGGYDNAYTDNEITNYYFKIQHNAFLHALNIFSRFFIDPLMSESSMEREMNAVHSEHSKNITSDHWRKSGIISYLSHKKSIYNKFGTGNLETLDKDGLNDALHSHHSKYYSSNNMNLVVVGPQSLDELNNLVTSNFSEIPNKNINFLYELIPSKSQPIAFPHKYDINMLNTLEMTDARKLTALRVIQITPIKKEHVIRVLWELPTYNEKYKYAMMNLLSHIIGNEGKGSILYVLQKHSLVLSLSAGISESDHFISTFEIDIEVTDKGFEHRHIIIALVHDYINMMRNKGLSREIYDEYKQLSYNSFIFRSKYDEAEEANSASRNMFYYSIEDTFSTQNIMNEYDNVANKLYDEYIGYMQPETSIVILSSLKYENTLKNTEKWYGVNYTSCEYVNIVPSFEITENINFDISLPSKNAYIPTDFSIKNDDEMQYPEKYECNKIECWYKHIKKYGLPKAYVMISLYNKADLSLEQYLSLQLYINSKLDELNNEIYAAELAGLSLSIIYSEHDKSVYVYVSGYNHKITNLLKLILTEFQNGLTEEYYFNSMKENYKKKLRNILLSPPESLTYYFLSKSIDKLFHDPIDSLGALDTLQFSNVNYFGTNIFNNAFTSIKLVVEGNVSKSDMNSFIDTLSTYTSLSITDVDLNLHQNILLQSNLEITKSVMNTEENDSCTLLVYPCGYVRRDIHLDWKEKRIGVALSIIIMGDKFFDQLRTKEQLGYTTYMSKKSFGSTLYSSLSIVFAIQSDTKDPNYLDQRMLYFINEYYTNIISNFSEAEFDKHKNTLRKQIEKPYNNLSSEAHKDSVDIICGYNNFDSKCQLLKRLDTYSFNEFLEFFRNNIIFQTPIKVKVYGNLYMGEYEKL